MYQALRRRLFCRQHLSPEYIFEDRDGHASFNFLEWVPAALDNLKEVVAALANCDNLTTAVHNQVTADPKTQLGAHFANFYYRVGVDVCCPGVTPKWYIIAFIAGN